MEAHCVLCEVRIGSLRIMYTNIRLQGSGSWPALTGLRVRYRASPYEIRVEYVYLQVLRLVMHITGQKYRIIIIIDGH